MNQLDVAYESEAAEARFNEACAVLPKMIRQRKEVRRRGAGGEGEEAGGGEAEGGCKYQPKLNQNKRKRAEHRQMR